MSYTHLPDTEFMDLPAIVELPNPIIAIPAIPTPLAQLVQSFENNQAANVALLSADDLEEAFLLLCNEIRTANHFVRYMQLINWLETTIPNRLPLLIEALPYEDLRYWIKYANEEELNKLKSFLCDDLNTDLRENHFAIIVEAIRDNRFHTLTWLHKQYPNTMESFVDHHLINNKDLMDRVNSVHCDQQISLFFLRFLKYFPKAPWNPTTETYINNKLAKLKILAAQVLLFDIPNHKMAMMYYFLLEHIIRSGRVEYMDDIAVLLRIPAIKKIAFTPGDIDCLSIQVAWSCSNFNALAVLCKQDKLVNFNCCALYEKSIEEIRQGFKQSLEKARIVSLKFNQLNQLSGDALAALLNHITPHVTTVMLESNDLGKMAVQDLSSALTGLPKTVQKLTLKNNALHHLITKDLSQLTARLEQITELHLSNDEISLLPSDKQKQFLQMFPNASVTLEKSKSPAASHALARETQGFFLQHKETPVPDGLHRVKSGQLGFG